MPDIPTISVRQSSAHVTCGERLPVGRGSGGVELPAGRVRRVAALAVLVAAAGAVVTGVGVAGAVAVAVVVLRRVEVRGDSMAPTLQDGDRLVVVRCPSWVPLSVGAIVAVRDPRDSGRGAGDSSGSGPGRGSAHLLVKRVHGIAGRGPLGRRALVDVRGDHAAASTDSRHFGPVPRHLVIGPVVYRYAPPGRRGAIR